MIEAITWVSKQNVRPSSVKYVLLALANFLNEAGEAYPSIETICRWTSQDRKTVIGALDQLNRLGLIADTGKRKGSTHQVKVYRFTAPIEAVPKTELLKSPEFPSETVPDFPTKGPEFPSETVPDFPTKGPENGTQNRQGTVNRNRQENLQKESSHPLPPEGGESACESRCLIERKDQDVVQHAEAKRLFGRIAVRNFEEELRENQWSARRMQWLDEILPLKRGDWELVDWYYSLPPDAPARVQGGKLRRSLDSLLENFGREVQKVKSVAKDLEASGADSGRPREPKDWRKIFYCVCPNRPPPPESYWNLQVDERRVIEAELEKRKKGPPLWREFFAWKHNFPHLPQSFAELPTSDLRKEWDLEHEAFEQSLDWWHPIAKALWGERDDLPRSILQMPKTARGEVLQMFWKKMPAT